MIAKICALALALSTAPALADDAPLLHHVPVIAAASGQSIWVAAESEDFLEMGQVELFYRRADAREWRSLGFARRADGSWAAQIPGDEVTAPGLEYYIAAGGDDRYASAEAPQEIAVTGASRAARFERELARYDGQRSQARVGFDYTSFGAQDELADYMWAVNADFTYRVLAEIRSLRFGISRMRAEGISLSGQAVDPAPGYDHGFAEIEVALHEYLGAKGQVQLGANQQNFTAGGEGRLRIGLDPGTRVELYGGGAGGVGGYFGMLLGWDTVPSVPMAAGVRVTDWPNGGHWAVQLDYQALFPLGEHLDAQASASYQARTSRYGGLGGGLGVVWSF